MLKYTSLGQYLDEELLPYLERVSLAIDKLKRQDPSSGHLLHFIDILSDKLIEDSILEIDPEYNDNIIPFERK